MNKMCFAIPGKIIELREGLAIVSYGEEKREAKNFLDVDVGDYVIVNGGFIIKKVPETEALEAIEMIKNLD